MKNTYLRSGLGAVLLLAVLFTVGRSVLNQSSNNPASAINALQGGGPAILAELPRATVDTTYPSGLRQVRVAANANLQTAIDNAKPGDELLLPPGATYVGNFTLPNKGNTNGWIVIRTDLPDSTLGAPGTRMNPTQAANLKLAKILSPIVAPAITTDIGANHYRFTGVDIGPGPTAPYLYALVSFGSTDYAQNSPATTANNLIIDRSYLHGAPTYDLRRCLALNSASSAVIDSWFADCHSNDSDSQAIAGWNGPGPFLIQNNHLEAGHEVFIFGGGTFTITNGSPSDITIRGNHIMRPLSWFGVWQQKNLIETKHAKRVLIENNVIENNKEDAQSGYAFVMKSENQQNDNPWTQTSDVTIRYNLIRNVGSVFNFAARGSSSNPNIPEARASVYDNVIQNVNVSPFVAQGIAFLIMDMTDLLIAHNTILNAPPTSGELIQFDQGQSPRLTIVGNVGYAGQYGLASSKGYNAGALAAYASDGLFADNLIVGLNAYPLSCSGLASSNACPTSLPTSLPLASDGRPVGADIARVTAATANAISGNGSGAPYIPPPVSTPAPTVSVQATPSALTTGQTATLSWNATNATSCIGTGAWNKTGLSSSGSLAVSPVTTGTYTITCSGTGGTGSGFTVINVSAPGVPPVVAPVVPPPTSPVVVPPHNTPVVPVVAPVVPPPTSPVVVPPHNSPVPPVTTPVVPPVLPPVNPGPSVTIQANPTAINAGQSSQITWVIADATSCSTSGAWNHTVTLPNGAVTAYPVTTSTYIITCMGPGGTTSASATVTVSSGHVNNFLKVLHLDMVANVLAAIAHWILGI